MTLTRAQRAAVWCVAAGALLIALIGFTGSYAAVQGLAARKGFGGFSYVFPVGVDVGIAVLLALDLVLTWLRIPFPLLRHTAWLLTAGTIVFNAASAWPDALAVAMHAIIPILFVVVVEAARHAVGRLADISVDRHMESVRLVRWVLAPVPTFRLWRRMKLWEMRSYDEVVQLEQNRLVYRTRLRAQYGRRWRRQAPVELLLPLKLARYGVPLPSEPSGNFPEGRAALLLHAVEKIDGDTAELEPVEPVVPSESTDLVEPGETDIVEPLPDVTLPGKFPASAEAEPELSALEVATRARLERLREARRQAAASWWVAQLQTDRPTFNEHAKASGISVPTLRKSIAEFPEPVPEVAP
ncbi:DUF2637 domain-containing protein [Streptacidiphilus albus]|uniref:DUF2637 domain-containing protein n=1 Tax=Streptacidiphilus albus TaxID=105425 RepID=UPI0009DDF812|nr:DUF2637 domain-containing protein [Streptacidiphilus albus]